MKTRERKIVRKLTTGDIMVFDETARDLFLIPKKHTKVWNKAKRKTIRTVRMMAENDQAELFNRGDLQRLHEALTGVTVLSSDRNLKENIEPVSGQDVLARLATLPIASWNYKTENAAARHIGPMAQDFGAAFGVGSDETAIAVVDAHGVALAAIQGLNAIVSEKDAQIADLAARLELIETQLPRT